ncbi:MAG: DUF2442 domain-containing protein [Pyrinomonadaceae bacterium]
MSFKFYKVKAFEITGPYNLLVSFDDGTSQRIDFSPVLFGRMYGPLRDLQLFESVTIDPEVHTLVWPNGADFNPAMLHDWNENAEEIRHSAAKLDRVSV